MKYVAMLFFLSIAVQGQSQEYARRDSLVIVDPITSAANTKQIGKHLYEHTDAQTDKKEIFRRVDKMPQAGYDIMAYLSKQLTFPASDSNYRCTKTIVQFTIEASGTITHPRILKSCNPQLDDQILSAIRNIPKWQPAEQKGKPIATLYSFPIIIAVK